MVFSKAGDRARRRVGADLAPQRNRKARNGWRVIVQPPLAKKHQGMKISASGILLRVGGHLRFGASEMDRHLKEMATRYYAGDIAAVDEFLQLYCLDDKRQECCAALSATEKPAGADGE